MSFTAGSVWWCKVDFNDGEGERKKYLILLTDCVNAGDQSWIAVTTTKGEKRYPSSIAKSSSPCGCPKESCFRIDAGQEQCFPDRNPTLVQFDNCLVMGQSDLVAQQKAGKVGFIQALNAERLRSILNCAKKSKDVAKTHLSRVEKTLKALNPVKPKLASATHAGLPLAIHIDRYCESCRTNFLSLVGIQIGDLAPLKAAQPPTKEFLDDIQAGTELVKGCHRCGPP